MINKLECTCIEAYKSRKMRDPNCCACSCDHNDLVEQLAKANEDYKALFCAFESCQDELKESNERVKELESAILDSCSTYHFEPDLSQPASSLKELLRINSKWTLNPEISSDAARFAIEKKIETLLEARKPFYQKEADLALYYGLNGTDCKKVTAWFDSKIKQLRKEQE